MGESGTGRMQVPHHSTASLFKVEANGDCKNMNGSTSSKCSNTSSKKLSSQEEVGKKYEQNGVVDVQLCPKGHICHKCSSSLFGNSSVFYGSQDYVPGYSQSYSRTRTPYNSEAVMDESGADLRGNIWLGSYHY